jgi:ABC-type antimicrobial peptide transport system permease subunit
MEKSFPATGIGSGFLGVPFIIDPGIGLTAFLFSAAVGVVFSHFPARKAACLSGKNP